MTDSEKIAHLQETMQVVISYVIHLSVAIRCGDNPQWIEDRLEEIAKEFSYK